MQEQPTARVIFYNEETHVELADGRQLAEGDVIPAYRGNGPREGEQIGWAVVRGVKPVPGSETPELSLHISAHDPRERDGTP